MAGARDGGRALVKKIMRDPRLPWGEAEDALAVAKRLTLELEDAGLRILWPLGSLTDVKILDLNQRADAVEKKLNELIIEFTPSTWTRIKGGAGVTLAAVSFVGSLAIPPLAVVGGISSLFAADDAAKLIGTEHMRRKLKLARTDIVTAAMLARIEARARGI